MRLAALCQEDRGKLTLDLFDTFTCVFFFFFRRMPVLVEREFGNGRNEGLYSAHVP